MKKYFYHKRKKMDLNFENRFWLQILGDHLRFIEGSLHVKEAELLGRVKRLKETLDELLKEARSKSVRPEKILPVVEEVKKLKLDILHRHINGEIKIGLPPTFINHMINELESFEKILLNPDAEKHVLEDHYLWQSDAKGHAISLLQKLDPTEKKLMKEIKKVKKAFGAGFNATIEYIGYLRTGNAEFPALDKLNNDTLVELLVFLKMLETMKEERMTLKISGSLDVLLLDHMGRESSYAMKKILEHSGKQVSLPFSPDRERVE